MHHKHLNLKAGKQRLLRLDVVVVLQLATGAVGVSGPVH